MFCGECGASNASGVKFCSKCGNQFVGPMQQPMHQQASRLKKSVASFGWSAGILGLLGIVFLVISNDISFKLASNSVGYRVGEKHAMETAVYTWGILGGLLIIVAIILMIVTIKNNKYNKEYSL